MQFTNVLNETSIKILATLYNRSMKEKDGIFFRSDDKIKNSVNILTDDEGNKITDIEVAKKLIKNYGINPENPKILVALQQGVQNSIQAQTMNQDMDSIKQEKEKILNTKKQNYINRLKEKGWVV